MRIDHGFEKKKFQFWCNIEFTPNLSLPKAFILPGFCYFYVSKFSVTRLESLLSVYKSEYNWRYWEVETFSKCPCLLMFGVTSISLIILSVWSLLYWNDDTIIDNICLYLNFQNKFNFFYILINSRHSELYLICLLEVVFDTLPHSLVKGPGKQSNKNGEKTFLHKYHLILNLN